MFFNKDVFLKRFIRLLILPLSLFYLTNLSAMPTASSYTVGLLMGMDLSPASQSAQDVTLSPAVTNSYGSATAKTGLDLFGINFGYQLKKPLKAFDVIIGVDLLHHSTTFSGTETPYVNNGGGDALNYSYDAANLALLGRTTFVYTIRSWHPYGFIGVGPSYNQLSNYSESAVNSSGSATPLPPYQSNNALGLAYELGVGVQKDIHKNFGVAADLRYISFGKGSLSAPAGNYYDSSAKLNANNMGFLGITISGTYRF